MNPRRDIHSVTHNGVIGENHVADVNPDPHAQLRSPTSFACNFACAINRIDRAVKARKRAVADLAD